MLNIKEKQALEEFKTQLLAKLRDNLVLIRLYGSKARGDYHKGSDIDILIVVKHKKGSLIRLMT